LKKTPLLITIGILLLIVGGYYAYEKFLSDNPIKPWDLVPTDAIIIYEKNDCNSCTDEISNSVLLRIIESAAYYNKPIDSLRIKIGKYLIGRPGFLISTHVTKKDDFDFVFYSPNSKSLTNAVDFFKIRNYKLTTREFNSILIYELKFAQHIFSYAVIDDVWIGSFTPFLVEDVVRTYKFNARPEQQKSNLTEKSFATVRDDAGNLHVSLEHFSDLLAIFSYKASGLRYTIGETATLDLKQDNNSVVLNGFSTERTDQSKHMLSIFQHQSPVSFGLKHIISNRAIAVSSYGISDGKSFYEDRKSFVQRNNPQIQDTLVKLARVNKFELRNFYDLIADEFGVCFVESSRGRKLAKILMIETNEPEKWLKTLDDISQKLSIDTVFYEKYAHYEIREIPIFRFSEKLLWPFVKGFEQNFYTSIDKVVVIADNLEELKDFLNDIDAEDTWGKSVSQNRFLESTLLESNVSFYFNPAKAWNVLAGSLQPKWVNFVKDHQAMLQALQSSSIQFSHLSNNFYTNILLTYKPFVADNTRASSGKQRIITNFDQAIASVHAVKSHVNRSNEVLIQDSVNNLSLVSSEGRPLWKLPIGDRIISDVTQIDFFNNGKLQYFFATTRAIHIIDRLGNYVGPYPLHLSSSDEIEHVSVVDYDNSKKYRILIADRSGNLWMFDKQGKALDGWRPKDIGGSLAMPPRHHRIKGKDYLLAVRKDGQVFLMNRRGENLRKFPVNTEVSPSGDYALEMGSTLEDTYFVIVSEDGFKIRFNVQGRVQGKETLMKTSVTSSFSLINEKSSKSYLILQQDGKQLSLSDEAGKKIISNNISGLKPSDVKYFDFGSGNIFIILTDKIQGFSYIYDGQGNLLTSPPIECTGIEIRPVSNDQFSVFYIYGRALTIQPL
jgi:hypothetical protein